VKELAATCIALLLLSYPGGRGGCELPQPAIDALKHSLAWLKGWYGNDYLTESELKFKVVQRGSRVLWFLRSAEMVFTYLPDSPDSYFHWSTCRPATGDWTECIKGHLEKQDLSIGDLLLGRGREPVPVRPEEICDLTISSATVRPWAPSPEGAEKRAVAAQIREAVKESASYWGTVRRVVCNDFNVQDPMLWCVVDIAATSGTSERLLIFADMNMLPESPCHVFRTEEADEYNKPSIEQVLRRPYKLWP